MYDNFKILNYSNSLVSPELFARHRSKLFTGNVANGLMVIPKTGLTVTLQTGNGFIPYGSGATASNREFSLVADFDLTLDTADASNPRIDYIVVYVDTAVTLPGGTPTAANLDGPGVVKATFVKGTPNASPVVPTVGAIQTKIGAANPHIIVAEVRVDATVTTIASNKITDKRTLVGPSASVAANVPDGSFTYAKGDGKTWWEEIGRTTLGTVGDTITVNSLPARKYLRVIVTALPSNTIRCILRFNNDTASNYSQRYAFNNGASTAGVSTSALILSPAEISAQHIVCDILNISAIEKIVTGQGMTNGSAGAAGSATSIESGGKWVNTSSQISRIDVINDQAGDFAVGSEVIVLGHN